MQDTPLAERMRPQNLDELVGQQHLVGKGGVLRNAIESGNIMSMIFWGPPGVGKTTLAYIIANTLKRPFFGLSAINSGVKEIREVIEKTKSHDLFASRVRPILFIDEIHRFNKSQQDALLGVVEKGTVTLIGATTENPSFEVNSALLSRCQVYVMRPLERDDLEMLLQQAFERDAWLQSKKVIIKENEALLKLSGGDARRLLNVLEIVVSGIENNPDRNITNELVERIVQQKMALYDKSGEQHYDIISAFIKSMRGSDPNAAVYYLARMLEGGEDPLFIARRMLILASEDIGMANPTALVIANNVFSAVHAIGMPEARIILSHGAIYLATSPKSNSSYEAIENALRLVRETGDAPIPLHLRNAPTKLMKDLNYGKDYKYAHAYENNFTDLEFLPEILAGTTLYQPGKNVREKEIADNMRKLWKEKYGY
jgi:putative ATPase